MSDLPRAHGIATWGISYPMLKVRQTEGCDPALREAIESRSCCAYDISAGGTPRVSLLLGTGCPQEGGIRTWSDGESHCLLAQPSQVIGQACRPGDLAGRPPGSGSPPRKGG